MYYKKENSNYINALPGVKYKSLVYGDKTHLCEFSLEKNSSIPKHNHPHEQTGYMVSGHMIFTIDQEKYETKARDSWSIPGGVDHSVEVLEDSIVVEVFFPIREDYLPESK